MLEGFNRFLALNGYFPHGYCISWSTTLVSTFVVSDLLIFLSYSSMSAALIYFARRRQDFSYRWLLWLFAAFIIACGVTHVMGVVVLWVPLYELSALLKAITAFVSVITAIFLWPLLFRALKLPSPAQLRHANEALLREIAQRERAEKALRLVTDANHALVHAKDEAGLLDDICRLIVDTGGYRMAWVGFAEIAPEKTVRPMAQWGDDQGYLNGLRLSWDDTELEQGPTGTALRTGLPKIDQYARFHPAMYPWRDTALKHGYQSSLALPLINQGRTLGALTIYSADPNSFCPPEVKLLEELASNIAYGLETLRVRAMKRDAKKSRRAHRRNLETLVAQRTAELSAAKCDAENANNAKSRFLAAASHDLRQPLSALSLYVGMLKDKLTHADAPLLEGMSHCVANLSEMLSDLLDLSKLEAGVVTPTVSEFAVDAILAKVVSTHAPEANMKGLALRCRAAGLIGHTDPVLFQRIVGNLVANAIRYTEQGGVLMACRRRQGRMHIEVWDTGIGIPPDKTAEIFEEFKQLDNPERNRAKGSGLGLAIAAKTAALLGLAINVRSRPGKGSVFSVSLPEGDAVLPVAPPEYAHRPRRIALVEDNAEVAAALVYALTTVGHSVVASASYSDILPRLGALRPDIVISDYRLAGGETGIDVVALFRLRFGSHLPALIITGDTDPAVIRRMAMQRISVQHKPLDLDRLRKKIAELTA
jgi:signal transduction histidine kinase